MCLTERERERENVCGCVYVYVCMCGFRCVRAHTSARTCADVRVCEIEYDAWSEISKALAHSCLYVTTVLMYGSEWAVCMDACVQACGAGAV